MNQMIVPQNFGVVSSVFAGQPVPDDMSAGIQGGFGVISIKGKTWRTRYRGDETVLMRPDGTGPLHAIPVVILKAAPVVSKIWYEKKYEDGSDAAPDCWSTNGVTPAAGAPKKQSAMCQTCPMNAWGSRITESGKQGKACADSKRLAVVPGLDIRNELMGGPMLLRVPAASLGDMATFSQKMAQLGYPYYAFITEISFAVEEAFPKLVFKPVRPLTDEEAKLVLEMQNSVEVARVLAEDEVAAPAAAAPAQPPVELPAAFAGHQAPAPVQTAAAPMQQPVQSAPVQQVLQRPAPVQPAPQPVQAAAGGFGGAPATTTAPAPQKAAQPAPGVTAGGFGAAPAAQPAPAAPVQTAPVPAQPSSFELDLDAKLNAMMPS